MWIAEPRLPLKRFNHFESQEIRVNGWAEVQVGEEPVSRDGEQCNVVYGIVVAADDDRFAMVVSDEVQDEALTGLADGDVVMIEACHVLRGEYTDAELNFAARMAAGEVVKDLVARHQDEFNRRYPEFAPDAHLESLIRLSGEEAHTFTRRWWAAHEEFANSLIANGSG